MTEPSKKKRDIADFIPLIAGAALICLIIAAVMGTWVIISADKVSTAQDDINKAQADIRQERASRKQIERERVARTDQSCEIFERVHLADIEEARKEIRDWEQTQKFLDNGKLGQPLTDAIRATTPERLGDLQTAWKRAAIDIAPPYCDEPGAAAEAKGADPVGLPEPDPIVPDWPKDAGPQPKVPGDE